MWMKNKDLLIGTGLVDSEIVERDFIAVQGTAWGYDVLNKGKKELSVPVFHLFYVHPNHPIKISSIRNWLSINPVDESGNQFFARPSAGLPYGDKLKYDYTSLILLPFPVNEENENQKQFKIKEGFTPCAGPASDVFLSYIEQSDRVLSFNSDYSHLMVSRILPPQIPNHLSYWMEHEEAVYSLTPSFMFNLNLEGKISVPPHTAKSLTNEIVPLLEERYNTKLR